MPTSACMRPLHNAIWRDLPPGEHRLTCPHCSRGKRDKTLGVTVGDAGDGVAHCARCEYVETHQPERPGSGLQLKPQRHPAQQVRRVVAPQQHTCRAGWAWQKASKRL